MSPLSKGGGGTASSDVQGSTTRGEATGPIGSQFNFSSPVFLSGTQGDKGRQSHAKGPTCSKKRRTDVGFDASIDAGTLLHAMQDMIAEALSGLNGPRAVAECSHDVQVIRAEMEKELQKVELNLTQLVTTAIASIQAEADRRADAMLQSLQQTLANKEKPAASVTTPQPRKRALQEDTTNAPHTRREQISWPASLSPGQVTAGPQS